MMAWRRAGGEMERLGCGGMQSGGVMLMHEAVEWRWERLQCWGESMDWCFELCAFQRTTIDVLC